MGTCCTLWGILLLICRGKKSLIGLITTDNCIVDSLRILASFKHTATQTLPSLTVRKPRLPSQRGTTGCCCTALACLGRHPSPAAGTKSIKQQQSGKCVTWMWESAITRVSTYSKIVCMLWAAFWATLSRNLPITSYLLKGIDCPEESIPLQLRAA